MTIKSQVSCRSLQHFFLNGFAQHFLYAINEEIRQFDVKPYLEKGIFKEWSDEDYFKQVSLCFDSIS